MPIETIKVTNIFDLIDLVRMRLGMYIGSPTLTALDLFLTGYTVGIQLHKVEHSPYTPPFYFFHDWVNRYYDYGRTSMGWRHIILENENKDEELSLKLFFTLYDSFKKIEVESVWIAEILSGEQYYIQLVEFSDGLGVAEYCLDSNGNRVGLRNREMFNDIKEAKERSFHSSPSSINWIQVEVDIPKLWSKLF